jgi:hypothetical protein
MKAKNTERLVVYGQYWGKVRRFIAEESDRTGMTQTAFVTWCIKKVMKAVERKREKLTTKTEIDKIN